MVNAWMAKVPPLVVWDGSHGEDEREIVDSLGLLVVAYEVRLWSEDFHQCQHLATNLVHAGQVLVLRDLGDDSEADTHRCACGFLQCRPHPSFCACIRTSAVNFCLGADDNETTYITMAFIVSFCSLLLHLVAQPYVRVPQLCVLCPPFLANYFRPLSQHAAAIAATAVTAAVVAAAVASRPTLCKRTPPSIVGLSKL